MSGGNAGALQVRGPTDFEDGKLTDVSFVGTPRVFQAKKIHQRVRVELEGVWSIFKSTAGRGLDQKRIVDLDSVGDVYGAGTSIADGRVIDFAMGIVEIDEEPLSKRGKMSGTKSVLRC